MMASPGRGMKIDAEALAKELNIPVIPIIASKNQGLDELLAPLNRNISAAGSRE